MRIGLEYTAALTQTAGIGRYVRNLVPALAELDQENEYLLFHARVHKMEGFQEPSLPPNFKLRPIGVSDRTLTILWHRLGLPLPIDLFTGPVDVFHFPNFTLAPLRRGAAIVTVHDLSFLLVPECADDGLRQYLERVVPASVAAADVVVADSASTRNDLICLLDVPPERVEVVYGGVEPRFRRVTEPDALTTVRRKYGLTTPFVLFVGTVEPRKNLVRLIQAYHRLRQRPGFTHKLVIAGGLGWLYQDVFREIENLGLHDHVLFIGYVADPDLPAIYSLADALAWPSLYEGFGLPPLEAMGCGTPVVTSNVSSLPELIGDAGITVDPRSVDELADGIDRVLTDQVLRTTLIARGVERARLFTWQSAAEKLLAICQRAVTGATRAMAT
ncbi:MAG: glycosyltransferase family 4 protein [Chloroflexi bacterium]|nr:glycosyltransferase family 4 protein [Chloroflexota bacterium]